MSEIETITPPGNAAADLPLLADVLPQDDPTAKPAKPAKARDISGLVLVDTGEGSGQAAHAAGMAVASRDG